jgi:DNA-binding transcriptional LysR family regulator
MGGAFPMLDWDDLRFFLAVARAGSLSAAARTLGVTQPTVGRRITGLEQKLGAKLFLAVPSGQSLSPTGQLIFAHARAMELEATAAERIATGRDSGLQGRVRITATEWMIESVLSPLLGPFLADNPELELDLAAEVRHVSLAQREADIAIRPSQFEHRDVIQRQIAVVAFALYASDGYLARRGVPNFERRCEDHKLILMSESLRKIPDVEWLPKVAARAKVAVRANSREAMVALAAAGLGITCLPRFLGDQAPGLRLLSTPAPLPERKLSLGFHRDSRSVPRVRATAAFIAKCVERLRPALCPGDQPR